MIGVGIIGYGHWGPNLARCCAETEACRLVAISDTSMAALGRARKRYPAVDLYPDWRRLLADPEVDAVEIATPAHSHYDLAHAALAAGKHVLVEKPMTETSRQAENLIEMASRRGLVLMVDHTLVYTGAVQKLRELISRGDLGKIYYSESTRVNLGLFHSDVNVIWDLAVHDLATLYFILDDKPAAVSANGTSHVGGTPENMAHVTLYYGSGTIANLTVNWLAPVKIRQMIIGGSRKMVIYDDLEPSEKIKVYDRGIRVSGEPEEIHGMRVSYRIGDMWSPMLNTKEALLTEAEHFVACVHDGGKPLTDGRMGLRVVEVLEGATASMRRRGQPVELTPLQAAS